MAVKVTGAQIQEKQKFPPFLQAYFSVGCPI